jgi:hypothetical protein
MAATELGSHTTAVDVPKTQPVVGVGVAQHCNNTLRGPGAQPPGAQGGTWAPSRALRHHWHVPDRSPWRQVAEEERQAGLLNQRHRAHLEALQNERAAACMKQVGQDCIHWARTAFIGLPSRVMGHGAEMS